MRAQGPIIRGPCIDRSYTARRPGMHTDITVRSQCHPNGIMTSQYLSSLFSLEGKTALITYVGAVNGLTDHTNQATYSGGTRGIGQALALAIAKAGANIILVQVSRTCTSISEITANMCSFQRDTENVGTQNQIKALGRDAVVVLCDLASKEQVSTIVHKITSRKEEGGLGRVIDILINCAGIQRR